MSKKAIITDVSSGYRSRVTLNDNYEALNDAFDNTLSRDGSGPNQMEADFDMNSNDILNTKDVFVYGGIYVDGIDLTTSIDNAIAAGTEAEYWAGRAALSSGHLVAAFGSKDTFETYRDAGGDIFGVGDSAYAGGRVMTKMVNESSDGNYWYDSSAPTKVQYIQNGPGTIKETNLPMLPSNFVFSGPEDGKGYPEGISVGTLLGRAGLDGVRTAIGEQTFPTEAGTSYGFKMKWGTKISSGSGTTSVDFTDESLTDFDSFCGGVSLTIFDSVTEGVIHMPILEAKSASGFDFSVQQINGTSAPAFAAEIVSWVAWGY